MKILHTSDWHLGKRIEKHSRLEEQKLVMQEIADIAEQNAVDLVIIAGDLFDTFNPPIEAEELFYRSLRRLSGNGKRPVLAIAGNHDSPDRIEAPEPLAREMGIFFTGYPSSKISLSALENGYTITKSEPGFVEIQPPETDYPVRILFTPYANEFRLKSFLGTKEQEEAMRELLQQHWSQLAETYCDNKGVNLLATHLFVMKEGQTTPEEPDDEKPILHVGGAQAIFTYNIPEQIQYTALGHLHRRHHVDSPERNIWYSGSPLSYSFSEAGQEKFVNLITVEPNQDALVEPVKLQHGKPLIRKRFEDIDDAVIWLNENQEALVELTIVADNYLTAEDRKRLQKAHPAIITIIPEIKNKQQVSNSRNINLQQNMEELFEQYFKHHFGQEPNPELMDLFKELQAQKGQS